MLARSEPQTLTLISGLSVQWPPLDQVRLSSLDGINECSPELADDDVIAALSSSSVSLFDPAAKEDEIDTLDKLPYKKKTKDK